ncbi:unnamed protein product [Kuraishia capsulata CBS 1993]|uniref:Uncharacterized protein n=1 Tax=Kuraishia capsulata CBS 1993 TaxID=1382522 RepID=W6MR38_9ASCO|nr:uncharacterized protein KUCA_T00005163001 [Kuraishia capsulata CBS 1993]CDK29176.1 unnamed protein product [Kuraishia capsulata CBS 1993]
MAFMIFQAIQYTTHDAALLFQIMFYRNRQKQNQGRIQLLQSDDLSDPDTSDEDDDSDNEKDVDNSVDSSITRKVLRIIVATQCYIQISIVTAGLLMLFNVIDLIRIYAWGARSDAPFYSDHRLRFGTRAQIFGWCSAASYIGSRCSQIQLNNKRKSCEGISRMFVLLKCLESVVSVACILSQSTGKHYMLIYSSWLVGYVGSLLLDLVILYQCSIYQGNQ